MNKYLALSLSLLLISPTLWAKGLTPKKQPLNNSYYVCYEKAYPVTAVKFAYQTYQQIHYKGCQISLDECKNQQKQQKLHQFGWFNNYNDAINSFYRCAYS